MLARSSVVGAILRLVISMQRFPRAREPILGGWSAQEFARVANCKAFVQILPDSNTSIDHRVVIGEIDGIYADSGQ